METEAKELSLGPDEVLKDLRELGYADPSEGIETALARYRAVFGLSGTGDLDEETLRSLRGGACGLEHLDAVQRENFEQYLERGPADYRWKLKGNVCRWTTNEIRVALEDFREDFQNAILRGLKQWAEFLPVHLVLVEHDVAHDVSIGFRGEFHGDISLKEPRMAHADYPGECRKTTLTELPIHFRETGHWNVGKAEGFFNLHNVALHEMGHVLGLAHDEASQVMRREFPANAADLKLNSSDADVLALQVLYGSGSGTTTGF